VGFLGSYADQLTKDERVRSEVSLFAFFVSSQPYHRLSSSRLVLVVHIIAVQSKASHVVEKGIEHEERNEQERSFS
jgi:hypothetical protein